VFTLGRGVRRSRPAAQPARAASLTARAPGEMVLLHRVRCRDGGRAVLAGW
jgi:hypothetical protein